MRILAAAIQMAANNDDPRANLERAEDYLDRAEGAGASLAVLPELVSTGYANRPDYASVAETVQGPFLNRLRERACRGGMIIAAGFAEIEGPHLYNSLALCCPDGRLAVYRKRNLVFWERFRFHPGKEGLVVDTHIGRIGLAVCADMIYRRVWDDYRGRIDLAIVASAWPEFRCAKTGRNHWFLGRLGPLCGIIPGKAAADLGIPVLFANQCGPTRTTIPLVGLRVAQCFPDRFAGRSSIFDGHHGPGLEAGAEEQLILSPITLHRSGGPRSWRSTFPSAPVASSSAPAA